MFYAQSKFYNVIIVKNIFEKNTVLNYGGGAVCGTIYSEAYFYFFENIFFNNSIKGPLKVASGSALKFFGTYSSSPTLFSQKNLYISNKAEVLSTIMLLYATLYEKDSLFLCKI